MSGERRVDDLLSALNEEKGKRWALRRFRLVKALGATEDSRAVEALSKVLRTDRSAEVRDVAVVALGRIGDPAAVPAVKDALKDPENGWGAIRSLGLLRDRSSVEWFIGFLSADDPLTREFAADALGAIGDRGATPALIAALDDAKWGVRQSAARALAKLEDPEAIEPVRRAHRSARCLSRRNIGWALAQLEGKRELDSKWPKNRIVFEQKFFTPFLVASMLGKAMGFRGAKEKRRAETQYLAHNYLRDFFSEISVQEPREFLEQAIEEFPDDPILRLNYVPILREIRPDDVVAEATKAAELGPGDPVIQVQAGHKLLNSDDLEGARRCAARASELIGDDFILLADLEDLIGRVAARDGDYAFAEEKLRSALQREPEWSSHWLHLARFLWARGRDEDALTVIDESLPLFEDRDRDLLERLRSEIAAD